MKSRLGSKPKGARFATIALSITAALSVSVSSADQADSAELFDDSIINIVLESRIQKPADLATAQERESVVNELTDLYLVTNLPRAIELGKSPEIVAQLDIQRRGALFNAFAGKFLSESEITDQEILEMYEEQVVLAPPEEFKARHILVDTQSSAIALIEELQDGKDFAELAKEHSTGPSASSGGDLGWFTAQAMVQPFTEAVTAMEDGSFTTTPVQTQFGWHVILREDSRDSTPPPLDSVKDVIRQRVAQQKLQDFIASLRSTSSD